MCDTLLQRRDARQRSGHLGELPVRYAMLETIRQFAEEALASVGDSDATRDVHAGFFADQADVVYEWLPSPREALVYEFVDTEIANFAAAFRRMVDTGQADPAVRIACSIHQIDRNRMRTETFGWAEEVIEMARRTGHRQLPLVLARACDSATGLGQIDDAIRFELEAVELNDDDRSAPGAERSKRPFVERRWVCSPAASPSRLHSRCSRSG